MDATLVAWARAVKARHRSPVPPLWLFTDPARMPDLERAVAALPPGLCGVVFRHDGAPGRPALLRRVARLCRERRLALVVAGPDRDVPAGAGRHLRGGRSSHLIRHLRGGRSSHLIRHLRGGRSSHLIRHLLTSSAHDPADIVRARRAGADAVFVSPAFPTASHPGAPALGPLRWAVLARHSRRTALALGGIDGRTAKRLPRWARGAGAIDALRP